MNYHVNRNGADLGIFSLEQLQGGYASGEFEASDLVWCEGMPEWKPLSTVLADMQDTSTAPSPDGTPPPAFEPLRNGPAWEQPTAGNVFERALTTVKGLITNPRHFFGDMRLEGGLAKPFWFYTLLSVIAAVVNLAVETPFRMMFFGNPEEELLTAGITVFLIPFLLPIAIFSSAGISHLFLMMLGGANRPFEATFRVNCYAYGAIAPVQAIPFLGVFVASVWGLVLEIFGLMDAHGISGGKATAVVLLPMAVIFLLCCGLFMTIGFAAAGL